MGGFLLTIFAAIALLGMAFVCLAIGKLVTGKSRLKRGTCGLVPPEKGKKRSKKETCSLCGSPSDCNEEKKQ